LSDLATGNKEKRAVVPSTVRRQWFQHVPDKRDEFHMRFFSELDVNPKAWQRTVTLCTVPMTLSRTLQPPSRSVWKRGCLVGTLERKRGPHDLEVFEP